jgi:hypothetical protein
LYDSKYFTAAYRIGQQTIRCLPAAGSWRKREAVDEAVDEIELPQEGIIR